MPRIAKRNIDEDKNDLTSFAHAARAAHMLVPLPEVKVNPSTVFTYERSEVEDLDSINDVCARVARGTLVTVAVDEVGIHWPLWHKWQHNNYLNARERYKLAYTMHLEVMADRTHTLIEALEAERKRCMDDYHTAYELWRNDEKRSAAAPIYKGPAEWELNALKEKLRGLYAHMKAGLDRFGDKTTVNHNVNEMHSTVHEITIKSDATAEEALQTYHRLIEGAK